jgi:hypothetical protein
MAYRELVDVDLDEDGVGDAGGQLLEGRLHEAAGPAPGRRERGWGAVPQQVAPQGPRSRVGGPRGRPRQQLRPPRKDDLVAGGEEPVARRARHLGGGRPASEKRRRATAGSRATLAGRSGGTAAVNPSRGRGKSWESWYGEKPRGEDDVSFFLKKKEIAQGSNPGCLAWACGDWEAKGGRTPREEQTH